MSRQHSAIAAATLAPLALGLAAGQFSSVARGGTRATATAASGKTKIACAASLLACPEAGCAHEGSSDAVTNALKRAVPAGGNPRTLTLDDFKRLQDDEVAAFGDDKIEPDEAERTKGLHN